MQLWENLPSFQRFGLQKSLNMAYLSIESALQVDVAYRKWHGPFVPFVPWNPWKTQEIHEKGLPPNFKWYVFSFPNPFGFGLHRYRHCQVPLCISLYNEIHWTCIETRLPTDLKYYKITLIMPSGPPHRITHMSVHRPRPLVLPR